MKKVVCVFVLVLLGLGVGPVLAGRPVCGDGTCQGNEPNTCPLDCQGGGGGGGGGDHSVTLTFVDNFGDGIQSDGDSYTDGDPGISARIRDDGLLLFNIGDSRELFFDFSQEAVAPGCGGNCKTDELPGFPEDVSTGDSPGAAGTVRVLEVGTNNELEGHLLGMGVGESLRARLKIGWDSGTGGHSIRWSVRFQFLTGDNDLDGAISANSTYAEITRTAQDSWFIEAVEGGGVAGAGDRGLLFSEFKDKGFKTQDDGTYHLPFGLTVTCPTCP